MNPWSFFFDSADEPLGYLNPFLCCYIIIIIILDLKCASLLHLSVCQRSPSGCTYLVAADTAGAVCVWTKSNRNQFHHYISLPTYKCVPSAILVDYRNETLIATYVDQKVSIELYNRLFLSSLVNDDAM